MKLLSLLFCFAIALAMLACSKASPTQKNATRLSSEIGSQMVTHLTKASQGKVFTVKPTLPSLDKKKPTAASDSRSLSSPQLAECRHLFLNDSNYLFDLKKTCIFIPEYAIEWFQGIESVTLFVSLSSLQVKFVGGDKSFLLDIDPGKEELKQLLNLVFGGEHVN